MQLLGDAAVFTHRVATRVRTNAGEEDVSTSARRSSSPVDTEGWLAVHEHLSSAG